MVMTHVGYVRLLSSYKFIPAGMIGEIFVGQRASENHPMYTYDKGRVTKGE